MSPAEAADLLLRVASAGHAVDVYFEIRPLDSVARPNDGHAPEQTSVERRRARQKRYRERRAQRLQATPQATQSYASATSQASLSPLDPKTRNDASDLGKKEQEAEETGVQRAGAREGGQIVDHRSPHGAPGELFHQETSAKATSTGDHRGNGSGYAQATPKATPGDVARDASATPSRRVRAAGRKGFPPEDFTPKESHRSLARERNVDLPLEVAKFKDHEFQRKTTDWDRAFSNWLRNARSSAGAGGPPRRPEDIRQKTPPGFDFSKVMAPKANGAAK